MDTGLKYPLKSHRKSINIPDESSDLAELMGIIFGDGGINNAWQLVISLNSELDKIYSAYVCKLFERLFGSEVASRKRPDQNTLVIVCSSMNLLDFLALKGAVRGNKILQGLNIPKWITRNKGFQKAFVRGLVDTDGCLYTQSHVVSGKRYSNIGFCFSSSSNTLLISVVEILRRFGVYPHVMLHKNAIYLYSQRAVLKYLNIFGSSNPRIFNKYQIWRGARAAD